MDISGVTRHGLYRNEDDRRHKHDRRHGEHEQGALVRVGKARKGVTRIGPAVE